MRLALTFVFFVVFLVTSRDVMAIAAQTNAPVSTSGTDATPLAPANSSAPAHR